MLRWIKWILIKIKIWLKKRWFKKWLNKNDEELLKVKLEVEPEPLNKESGYILPEKETNRIIPVIENDIKL